MTFHLKMDDSDLAQMDLAHPLILLQSCDGDCFMVPKNVATKIKMVEVTLCDIKDVNHWGFIICIPTVPAALLSKVIKFCTFMERRKATESNPDHMYTVDWESRFLAMDVGELFALTRVRLV